MISLEDNTVVVKKGLAVLKFDFRVDLATGKAGVGIVAGLIGANRPVYVTLDADEWTSLFLSLGQQSGFNKAQA